MSGGEELGGCATGGEVMASGGACDPQIVSRTFWMGLG